MNFEQNSITKKFVSDVKSLVQTGKAGTEKEIAAKLLYNYSAFNQIINGGRNVPAHVVKKYAEVYKPVEITDESRIIEIGLQNQAMNRVLLRAIAELLADKRKESVTKTASDLEVAVRAEIQLVSDKLR